MNISGHERRATAHRGDEETRVEVSSPNPSPCAPGDDRAILDALARRDRAGAAALLIQAHASAIGRTCMALLGSQNEAEDVLQDTLLAALNGLHGFRAEGTLRAWLLGIARRRCARRLTERSRERDARQTLGAAPPVPPGAERVSMARRARALLAQVRPTEREALVLRFAGELSFREVGEACGIDEAAARKRVSRGLLRLRELLGEAKS